MAADAIATSLLPLMFVTYGLQYLDKITLGYAAVLGLREDTVRRNRFSLPPSFSHEPNDQ
jgi:hypothetical protein